MSRTTFSPDILDSPFVSLDQILLSLTYSSDTIQMGQNFSLFLVPREAELYPFSVLGSLYAHLLVHPQISRIVYIRQDDIAGAMGSEDTAIDHVLGNSIGYDRSYYSSFDFLPLNIQKDFYTHSVLWARHVFYARFLENIQICPLVLSSAVIEDEKYIAGLMTYMDSVLHDPTTICVYLDVDALSWSESTQISLDHQKLHGAGKIFYDYCIQSQKIPALFQSESHQIDQREEQLSDLYHGIFVI